MEALFFTIPLQGQIALRVFGLQRLKGRVPSPLAERFMSIAKEKAVLYEIRDV
ncbi:MAG: hypothetical protein WB774_22080 [Xanthobacteraceae bacterium]